MFWAPVSLLVAPFLGSYGTFGRWGQAGRRRSCRADESSILTYFLSLLICHSINRRKEGPHIPTAMNWAALWFLPFRVDCDPLKIWVETNATSLKLFLSGACVATKLMHRLLRKNPNTLYKPNLFALFFWRLYI